jgi:hypothetical protein
MPENIAMSVGSKFVSVTASFTRPANATAYTAGDVVSNSASATTLMQFPRVVRMEGASGTVVKARLTTDKKDDTGAYRLFLYTKSEATVSVPADNAPNTAIYANRPYYIGFLDFPALTSGADTTNSTGSIAIWTGGVGSTTQPNGPLAFVADGTKAGNPFAAETAIYGHLVALGTPTPASGQNFSVELTVMQN